MYLVFINNDLVSKQFAYNWESSSNNTNTCFIIKLYPHYGNFQGPWKYFSIFRFLCYLKIKTCMLQIIIEYLQLLFSKKHFLVIFIHLNYWNFNSYLALFSFYYLTWGATDRDCDQQHFNYIIQNFFPGTPHVSKIIPI